MHEGAPPWRRMVRGSALGALVIVATLGGTARASCPGDPAPLAGVPVEARTAFLRDRLESEYVTAKRWTITWGIVDGALVAGQLAALPLTSDRSTQALLVAGAASGSLAFVQMIFFPVAVGPPPSDTGARPCEALAELEGALERGARNQALGSGPVAHASNAAINAALGIGTGIVGHSVWAGAATFGIGWAIGEAQILTQPTGLVRVRDRYRAGDVAPFALAPSLQAVPGGGLVVGVGGTF